MDTRSATSLSVDKGVQKCIKFTYVSLLGKSPQYGMAQYHTILWAQTNERNNHNGLYLQVKDLKLNSIIFGENTLIRKAKNVQTFFFFFSLPFLKGEVLVFLS